MSSSEVNSKIDFLDPPAAVRKKIKAAFCEEGVVENNGVLAFVRAVLMRVVEGRLARGIPLSQMQPLVGTDAPEGTLFTISRKPEYGGPSHFVSADDLEKSYAAKEVHPGDLKAAVADAVISLLEPIQKTFEQSIEWKEVERLAYPPPVVEAKKKKVWELLQSKSSAPLRKFTLPRKRFTIHLHRERGRILPKLHKLIPMLQKQSCLVRDLPPSQ